MKERKTEPTSFERKLILAMGLTSIDQLDELLTAPISPWAAAHSEPPDEEYDLADRMCQEAARQWDARVQAHQLIPG